VLEPFPCGADGGFDMGLFDCAFVCPKEKFEGAAEPLVSGADEGAVVGCKVFVKKVAVVELDETGPLAAGIDIEVCVTGFGAEGKGNRVGGAAAAVLASGLSFASLDWTFRDSVGVLNSGGGLDGSVTFESPFGGGGRENADAPDGGAIEGFSSGFRSGIAGKVDTAATFFASASLDSASAFAFSFSSALRRKRAMASASISCFSHFE
jgi:hypothetical protein